MLYQLAKHDGLLVVTSAALNVYAAFEYALKYKNSGKRIVTILCDSANRYQSKIFNNQFLADKNLKPAALY
jgi:cysteine synthase